jgi:solute:Na+ symporter, SSS family
MIAGFTTSFFWIFFIHAKESSSLQICGLIFGKPSLVIGTSLQKLSMVDPIFVALPVSIAVTLGIWFAYRLKKKIDIDSTHINKCFNGIK